MKVSTANSLQPLQEGWTHVQEASDLKTVRCPQPRKVSRSGTSVGGRSPQTNNDLVEKADFSFGRIGQYPHDSSSRSEAHTEFSKWIQQRDSSDFDSRAVPCSDDHLQEPLDRRSQRSKFPKNGSWWVTMLRSFHFTQNLFHEFFKWFLKTIIRTWHCPNPMNQHIC